MIKFIIKKYNRCVQRRKLTEELNSYSVRDLADMGLSKYDIPSIVERALNNED